MKRLLLCIPVVAFVFTALAGEPTNITTRDGKVYKEVEILNKTPSGIDISYVKEDVDVVRYVRMDNLTDDLQKKFGYDPQKAENYDKMVKAKLEKAEKRRKSLEEAREKQHAADLVQDKKQDELYDQIEASKIHVTIKVITYNDAGVLAWATHTMDQMPRGELGKVFVYGLSAPQGCEWAGNIYPLGKKETIDKNMVPCFAASEARAAYEKEKKRGF